MNLSVSDIYFSYNSHPVLADIDFNLEQGHVLGILGINGAGKSTLLKCLNRILRPQGGAVFLGNEDLLGMGQRRVARRVGYVPQRHPENRQTVYEAVLLGRKPHMGWAATQEDYQIVESILDQLALADFALRPVCDLSGGEVQKVVIARALAQMPKILLLDEPTSNLDLKNQLEVMRLIREVVESRKLSAVISIHDLNLAIRFADQFLLLKDHRVHAMTNGEGLTAEMVREVYGVAVTIQEVNGQPVVVPL